MEILFITSYAPNFQEDIIHEGLDELLGPVGVHCYPHKDYSVFQYNLYPWEKEAPHRPPAKLGEILDRRKAIAAVVVSSIRRDALTVWESLQKHFPRCPVAWLNGEDVEFPWPSGIRFTHRFKTNLLPAQRETGVFPLPFAAPTRAMLPAPAERDIPVSFAARSTIELRRLMANALQRAGFTVFLDADLPRDQFCWILNRSRIAVSLPGVGFDTFRYWEIPYHGALLLSQRLPIVIPDNFVDGESAVFFDDPEDGLAKIRSLLAEPERLAHIAAAGRQLCTRKHTAAARARYLLETMGFTF